MSYWRFYYLDPRSYARHATSLTRPLGTAPQQENGTAQTWRRRDWLRRRDQTILPHALPACRLSHQYQHHREYGILHCYLTTIHTIKQGGTSILGARDGDIIGPHRAGSPSNSGAST